MSTPPTADDLDRLAAFGPSVRAVAYRLVRDGQAAEDVVHGALLAAMAQGSGDAREPLGWFAGVVRNLARRRVRSDSARRRREQRVARPEATESAAEVVIRTETHHRLVASVLALDEPYRQTLLLRYFDELTPQEIAERLGVPGGTVRSRLTRGIALLRERLDGEEDGDRRAWALVLLPLAEAHLLDAPHVPATPSSPTWIETGVAAGTGVALMTAKSKLVAGAIVLLLIVLGVGYVATTPGYTAAPSIHLPAEAALVASAKRAPAGGEDGGAAVAPPVVPEEDEAVAAKELRFHGLVLNSDRTPAAGAQVRVLGPFDLQVTGTTDERGRYTLSARRRRKSSWERFTLQAWDDTGNAATEVDAVGGESQAQLPVLVLRPASSVTVRVIDAEDSPLAGVRVTCREFGGNLFGVGLSDSDGVARFKHLPDADVVILGYGKSLGRGVSPAVRTTREGTEVILRVTRRQVRCTVVLDDDGRPVAGVRLLASWFRTGETYFDPPLVSTPTDADGVTVLEDVNAEARLGLNVLPPGVETVAVGAIPTFTGGGADVPAGATEVTVRLPAGRRMSWPVDPSGSAAPANGTALELRRYPGALYEPHLAARAFVEDGEVVAHVDLSPIVPFQARAFTPDGSWCLLDAESDGAPVTFVTPRTVELRVVESDGSPVAGRYVRVGGTGYGTGMITDETGTVTLEGVPPEATDLSVRIGDFMNMHAPFLGSTTLHLAPDDEQVTATLPLVHDLVVRFTVDGEPRIPDTLAMIGTAWGRPYAVEELPGRAEARMKLRRTLTNPGGFRVYGDARGYLRTSAAGAVGEDGSLPVLTLDFVQAAEFRARVLAPEPRFVRAQLQRWDDGVSRWREQPFNEYLRGARRSMIVRFDGEVRVPGLNAGRYRLTDLESGSSTEPVDLLPGVLAPEVILQVEPQELVTGTIEFPPDTPRDDQAILMLVDGTTRRMARAGKPGQGLTLDADGNFTAQVPAGRAVTLRVLHPSLAPDSDTGEVSVTGARSDVLLQLARGRTVTFSRPRGNELPERIAVFAFEGTELTREPTQMRLATLVDGAYHVGGLPSGRQTLCVDVRGFAPIIRRDLKITAERVDLGELPLDRGARVTLAWPASDAAPVRFMATATSISPNVPKHKRSTQSDGTQPASIDGLLPGRYHLSVRSSRPAFEREITIDASGQVLEVELGQR